MTRADRRRILVCYDVADDRRRTRLAKTLESFGDRVQYSVFVVDGTPVALNRMRRAVENVADLSHDSVLFCDLGSVATVEASRFVYLGRQKSITGPESFIL